METGAANLAVGWPILEGACADGTWLRAPLLLYPVKSAQSITRVSPGMWAERSREIVDDLVALS